MRVLYVANAPGIGGGNRSLLTLWEAIRERGVEPYALIPGAGDMANVTAENGVPVSILEFAPVSLRKPVDALRQWTAIWRILRSVRPTLIHANDPITARPVLLAARILGIPVVCHCRMDHQDGLVQWVFKRVPVPRLLIFVSHSLRAAVGPRFERANPELEQAVVHNAVDIEAFSAREETREPTAQVALLANLAPIKGHEDFLRMARILLDSGLDAKFHILGHDLENTGYDTHLQERAEALGLADQVRFWGHVRDVGSALSGMDVLVVPSHRESFGRSVIEGMACALPVVGTLIGGIPEIIVEGETGFLVPSEDPDALADRVAQLLRDPDRSRRMGAAGRERAVAEFSAAAHAARIRRLYDYVLGGSKPPRPPEVVHPPA